MKIQSIRHLRKTSGFNVLVLLMSLVVFNGHCAAAYASASTLAAVADEGKAAAIMDHGSDHDQKVHPQPIPDDCLKIHSDDPSSELFTSSIKYKDKQDDLKPVIALVNRPPEPRAGPVDESKLSYCSADFVGPQLYYSLCVLRL